MDDGQTSAGFRFPGGVCYNGGMERERQATGYGFGTFQGVFTPSILTIIGVILYLRFGWMLGNVGLAASLAVVTAGSAITFLTGLSVSSLATNMRMRGGGAYFMLSRSFGAEAGAAMGIPLALSQTVAVTFYVVGFAEALTQAGLPVVSACDPRVVGLVTLAALAAVSTFSANVALKSQYLVMAAIAFSLVSFFLGGTPQGLEAPPPGEVPAPLGFWAVFAVFFPAVTGILSGVGMSGDLKEPGVSIPRGTIAAVLTGYLVYMAVPVALHAFVSDAAVLRTDTMILQKCARWPSAILLGVWAATLSSAVGSFLCAPRVFQALARDRLLPGVFGRGFGANDDPRLSALLCFGIAAAGLWMGGVNAIAPVLTMVNLSTYALLNLSAALEELMGNPSWRPAFRVRPWLSLAGFAGCAGAMFMISPGWTFLALGGEAAIFWLVKRRALRARWGDMRTGLVMAAVRLCVQRLERRPPDGRNWRPNVLAFTSLPVSSPWILLLARAISCNRGLVTVASVVPRALERQPARVGELGDALRRVAERLRTGVVVRVQPAADTWSGVRELVRTYGFGPLVPNTVLVGAPVDGDAVAAFGGLVCDLARMRRNLVVVREPAAPARLSPERGEYRIDVWWRGRNANGAFMLALACLVRRGVRSRVRLRLCQIAEPGTPAAACARALDAFVREARIEAEVVVVAGDGRPFAARICEVSAEADAACVGLRMPRADETPEDWWRTFAALRDATAPLPLVAFALASEQVDFRRIFAS